jgi:hypothetical protein
MPEEHWAYIRLEIDLKTGRISTGRHKKNVGTFMNDPTAPTTSPTPSPTRNQTLNQTPHPKPNNPS